MKSIHNSNLLNLRPITKAYFFFTIQISKLLQDYFQFLLTLWLFHPHEKRLYYSNHFSSILVWSLQAILKWRAIHFQFPIDFSSNFWLTQFEIYFEINQFFLFHMESTINLTCISLDQMNKLVLLQLFYSIQY